MRGNSKGQVYFFNIRTLVLIIRPTEEKCNSEYCILLSKRVAYLQTWRRIVMHKYEIIIYWDAQDRVYIAEVPELQGCTAHGHTYNEALDNAKEAIQL